MIKNTLRRWRDRYADKNAAQKGQSLIIITFASPDRRSDRFAPGDTRSSASAARTCYYLSVYCSLLVWLWLPLCS